jgi:hypothetical protein
MSWAAERDYAGWDPYDGLNAPLFDALPDGLPGMWAIRLAGMHLVHKAPLNLRRPLRVPKERNPKGVALFAIAWLHRSDIDDDGDGDARRQAKALLEWLWDNRSRSYDRPGWGYNFPWQNGTKFYLRANEPSIVVSVFCGRAFLEHFRLVGDRTSLRRAVLTAEFIRDHINTRSVDSRSLFTYTPSDDFVVVNANALAAGFFRSVADAADRADLAERARELAEFVVDVQTPEGAWHYAVPASDSRLSHDNFHTGFVLEALWRYRRYERNDALDAAYRRGLQFYQERLFESDGAPRFESNKRFPYDVHAAAQGIRTLALDGGDVSLRLGARVVQWAVDNLLDPDGYFYRRRGRFRSDRTPYMRWSQAWMCYGLTAYLEAVEQAPDVRSSTGRGPTTPGSRSASAAGHASIILGLTKPNQTESGP